MSRPSEKQVYIRSRRPHHPALSCHEDSDEFGAFGEVYADKFENGTGYEYWTLTHLGNDMYTISCRGCSGERLYLKAQGTYLGDSPDEEVSCRPFILDLDIEKWKIESTGKGYVSIKSCFNKYLCADEEFRVTASREHCELWEQWALVDEPRLLTTPPREVYIRSCQQQSFRNNDGLPALAVVLPSVKANRYGPATDDEKWLIICIDDNKVLLKLRGGFLKSDKNGAKTIISSERQPWTVENVEGASIHTVALKSKFGRYLCCEYNHFMCDGSVKADSTGCSGKGTSWMFVTDPSDINGNMALDKDTITMKDHVDEYA